MFYNLKDKKLKEQEKKGEILHRQLSKKTEKSPVSYRQPSSCLISQIQNTKALLKDRKVAKAGGPEKGQWEKGQRWVRVCMCGVVSLSLSCPVCCVFVTKDSGFAFPVGSGGGVGMGLGNVGTRGMKRPEETMMALSSQESSLSVLDRIPAVL